MQRVALPLAKISGLTANSLLFSPMRMKPYFWQEFVHDRRPSVKQAEYECQFYTAFSCASGSVPLVRFKSKDSAHIIFYKTPASSGR